MKGLKRICIAGGVATLLLGGLLTGAFIRPAGAISLNTGTVLKVGGVLLVVSQLGGQIDHFINGLLSQRKAELFGATKVVPIFSVGQGAYIGAAQVVGVSANVQRVQAVVAGEAVLNKMSGNLLIPISTKMPGKSLAKVDGVGVSAIVDLKL